MASVATIGGYTFADNEINLVTVNQLTRYSPRNRKTYKQVSMSLYGELIYSDTATIVSKVQALENAIKDDYKDFTYTVGGTLANSLTNSNNCLSGVKVISYSLPKGSPEQLATTRSVSITLQATYDVNEDNLISWTESIKTVGTGGPRFVVIDTVYGPYKIYIQIQSSQFYYQRGSAVGWSSYIDPPGPVNPDGEFLDRRELERVSGRNMGQSLRYFTTKWGYFMGRDVGTFGTVDYFPTSQ